MKSIKQADQIIQNPNKRGRPKGSQNKRTVIRAALSATFSSKGITGERGFWLAVAQLAKDGDLQAMAMLADRLTPKLKPTSQPVSFELPEDGTLTEKASAILNAIAGAQLDPATGRELLAAVSDLARITEVDELDRRLSALEELELEDDEH